MKSVITILFAVFLSFVFCSPAFPQKENEERENKEQVAATPAQIAELVKGLDDDAFKVREKSEQELLRIGSPALKAVRDAFQDEDSSAESRSRCKRILKVLSRSIRLIETKTHPDLSFITSTSVSKDGKFLYTAAWKPGAVAVFSRDKKSGKLKHLQTIKDPDLVGAVSFRMSQDGKLAAASSFNAKTATLFERNAETGLLEKKDVYRTNPQGQPLLFPTECAFTPDSKYLIVSDSKGLVVLGVGKEKKLSWIETHTGKQACFHDVRGIDFRPGKNQFYAASNAAGSIATGSWNKDTGKLTVDHVLSDGQGGVRGLAGAMAVAVTADGKFLYSSAGRFTGTGSVGAYAIQEDGSLKLVNELISGRDKVGQFKGGNELVLSLDNKSVYATGTLSSTLAGFLRDEKTGKLTFVETAQVGAPELGPAGISIDPSGDYIYVAVESASGIAVFKRDAP